MMTVEIAERRILGLFADILDYPKPGLDAVVRESESLLSSRSPEAAALLNGFGAIVSETPPENLEEVYTGTFDLNATCYPYVGFHLFGESYKRSVFMLELKQRYRADGFGIGAELPDHMSMLLRYLSICDDEEAVRDIIQEALLPVLSTMVGKCEEEEDAAEKHRLQGADRKAYGRVLAALRLALSLDYDCVPSPAGAAEHIPLPACGALINQGSTASPISQGCTSPSLHCGVWAGANDSASVCK
ncbi:MAG: nitrate reductase molybdenum cofactor assembly chaperone [Chloroflexi bacterium]|nr:nitrate reductase molybdenum cofactor assembly chaperone [Chloroflexota bacterium]